jgi:hypothetical protein
VKGSAPPEAIPEDHLAVARPIGEFVRGLAEEPQGEVGHDSRRVLVRRSPPGANIEARFATASACSNAV